MYGLLCNRIDVCGELGGGVGGITMSIADIAGLAAIAAHVIFDDVGGVTDDVTGVCENVIDDVVEA